MKKFVLRVTSLVIFVAAAACLFAPAPADAQVPYVGACCDAYGVRRCVINPSPAGSPCFCYGQGWGWACL